MANISTVGNWLAVVAGLLVVVSAGCRPAPAPAERDSPLAAQIDAIRRGESRWLRLDQTLVRDEDLGPLADVESKVERINFSRTELSDTGLAALCRCEHLEQLRISSPRVTDEGMAHLAALKQLRFLHLLDMPITDRGLDALHELKSLESVYLDRTKVTDDGIGRLLMALPQVHLHLDEHHHPLDPNAAGHTHSPAKTSSP